MLEKLVAFNVSLVLILGKPLMLKMVLKLTALHFFFESSMQTATTKHSAGTS